MDALPVEAVLEARAECSDADRARAALGQALIAARAPAHGGKRLRGVRPTGLTTSSSPLAPGATDEPLRHWTVTMTVAGSAPSSPKSVEAVIVDDAGTLVAQRTITDRGARACLPLARAVGAWASLVLDAEMNRATDDDGQEASSRPVMNSVGRASVGFAGTPPGRDLSGPVDMSGDRAGVEAESSPSRTIELGTMVYLRNGMTATGGIAGLAPFVTVEVSTGWVLRPGLFFGRSTTPIDGSMFSHLGTRADFCRRIPGNYIERRGIEADLCAGVEGGLVRADGDGPKTRTDARLGIGPAANLRGELGGGLALEVRALLGANMIQYASLAPLVFASAELGVSMRLP